MERRSLSTRLFQGERVSTSCVLHQCQSVFIVCRDLGGKQQTVTDATNFGGKMKDVTDTWQFVGKKVIALTIAAYFGEKNKMKALAEMKVNPGREKSNYKTFAKLWREVISVRDGRNLLAAHSSTLSWKWCVMARNN